MTAYRQHGGSLSEIAHTAFAKKQRGEHQRAESGGFWKSRHGQMHDPVAGGEEAEGRAVVISRSQSVLHGSKAAGRQHNAESIQCQCSPMRSGQVRAIEVAGLEQALRWFQQRYVETDSHRNGVGWQEVGEVHIGGQQHVNARYEADAAKRRAIRIGRKGAVLMIYAAMLHVDDVIGDRLANVEGVLGRAETRAERGGMRQVKKRSFYSSIELKHLFGKTVRSCLSNARFKVPGGGDKARARGPPGR